MIYFKPCYLGFLSLKDTSIAIPENATKNHSGILSGFNSATNGEKIVNNLANTPQIP